MQHSSPSDLLGSRARLAEEITSALLDERVAASYDDRAAMAEAHARLDSLLDRYPHPEV